MKFQQFILLILVSLLTFSCVDDLTDYGTGVLPSTDAIAIGADTFNLKSGFDSIKSVISYPDSFLLGKYYNRRFGVTKADILTQFTFPQGLKYPAKAVFDSAYLVLNFKSWYGDEQSPIHVVVHEMNKAGLQENAAYYTDINPNNYSTNSNSDTLGSKTFKMKDYLVMGSDTTHISIRLSDSFVKRMSHDSIFTDSATFHKSLKGAYVTTDFGSAVMMNVERLYIRYHYHYDFYNASADSIEVVGKTAIFSSNEEVRQVNRFEHPDRTSAIIHRDSVEYISSPANLYTTINLPLKRIYDSIQSNKAMAEANRTPYLTQALIRVDATEVTDSLAMPSYLMLIKKDYEDAFFRYNKVPTTYDTQSLLGALKSEYADSAKTTIRYYYEFDTAAMIGNEILQARKNGTTLDESINLKLIPVSVSYNSSGSVSAVKPQYSLSGVAIRSGNTHEGTTKIKTDPMYIKLIYSIF